MSFARVLQEEAKQCESGILVDENTRDRAAKFEFGSVVEFAKGATTIKAFPIAI